MVSKQYTVGVDVGGTNTRFAAVDKDGNVICEGSFHTYGFATAGEFAARLGADIRNMLVNNGLYNSTLGIGIGAPCANPLTGEIEAATDLPWPSPIPLARLVSESSGLPVKISNDANSAAIGEKYFGGARGLDNFIMLTLGTGVGAGVVCDGHLLSGSRGFAGELGHIATPGAKGRMCGCGREGCLQTVASAKGVVTTALQMLDSSDTPSALREFKRGDITAESVGKLAEEGDPLAVKILGFTGDVLGEACASYAAFTDPDAIILFGGVARSFRFIEPSMRQSLEKHALHLYRNRIRIFQSELPEGRAAILGAAALPFQ